jgi:molybdopterin converting factor subunit 1
MRVTVRLFARLREAAGRDSFLCDVPAGASVGDVWRQLAETYPALAPFGSSVSCAINADFARPAARVHDGDEVAFLPPVSGGAPQAIPR